MHFFFIVIKKKEKKEKKTGLNIIESYRCMHGKSENQSSRDHSCEEIRSDVRISCLANWFSG
jgi:hypothetical protein